MFKFNFSSTKNNTGTTSDEALTSTANDLIWRQAEHVLPSEYQDEADENSFNTYYCGQFHIKYCNIDSMLKEAVNSSNSIALAEQHQSDLLPANYEGGLKIWECTYDLSEYLLHEFTGKKLLGCKVLDLGCGAGLLGILTLKLQAQQVIFQDYNKEVLEAVTIPNVLANISLEDREKMCDRNIHPNKKLCQFYSGDWGSFAECLQNISGETGGYFDYILTSETIYNPANHEKLAAVFKSCLKRSGTVYLAAKTYYFGVGGGTRQFEDILSRDSQLTSNVCWKSEGGVQREILEIRFKH